MTNSKFPRPKQYGKWQLAYFSEQLQLFDDAANETMIYQEDIRINPPTMIIQVAIGDFDYHPVRIPIAAMKAWIQEWERWNGVLEIG